MTNTRVYTHDDDTTRKVSVLSCTGTAVVAPACSYLPCRALVGAGVGADALTVEYSIITKYHICGKYTLVELETKLLTTVCVESSIMIGEWFSL